MNWSGAPAAAAVRTQPDGDELRHVVAAHVTVAGVLPSLVPEKVTRHVVAVHVIVLVPLFLMVIVNAAGPAVLEAPAVNETPVTCTLWLLVAEPARP